MPPKYLEELEVDEVSFVDRAANKRRFLVLKKEDGPVDKILEVALGAELENEGEIDALAKEHELTEDATEAIKGAVRLVEAYAETIPEGALQSLAKRFGVEPPEEKKKGEHSKPKPPDTSDLPKATAERVLQMWESAQEEREKREKLEQRLDTIEEERENRQYIAKAAAFSSLPINADEFGPVLRQIAKSTPPEVYTAIETVLASTDAMLEKAKFFAELGSGQGVTAGGAFEKVQALATEIAKSEKMSSTDALAKALTDNPALAADYLREQKERTGQGEG